MSQSNEGGPNKTQSLEAPLITINNSYDCINLVKSTISHGRNGVCMYVSVCVCVRVHGGCAVKAGRMESKSLVTAKENCSKYSRSKLSHEACQLTVIDVFNGWLGNN